MSDNQMRELVADLVAEQETLDQLVAALALDAWDAPSPADGWTLRDCVAHLAEFDETAGLILEHGHLPDRPRGERQGVLSAGQVRAKPLSVAALLDWWRESRARLAAHAAGADPRARLPWFGPPMSARSFVTARL